MKEAFANLFKSKGKLLCVKLACCNGCFLELFRVHGVFFSIESPAPRRDNEEAWELRFCFWFGSHTLIFLAGQFGHLGKMSAFFYFEKKSSCVAVKQQTPWHNYGSASLGANSLNRRHLCTYLQQRSGRHVFDFLLAIDVERLRVFA